MRGLKRKLASRRGASITFALLIFLVCAIIGSVVIVASTAASGRVSQLARMDQRYYAVNSAAELVRDVLEGQEVVIETSKTVTVDQDGNPVETGKDIGLKIEVNDNEYSGTASDYPLLVSTALVLAAETDDNFSVDAPDYSGGLALNVPLPGNSDPTGSPLNVLLTPQLGIRKNAEGEEEYNNTLLIDVSNVADAGSIYKLQAVFQADLIQATDNLTEPPNNLGTDDSGNVTYTQEKKTTTTTTVRLKLSALKTLGATEVAPENTVAPGAGG